MRLTLSGYQGSTLFIDADVAIANRDMVFKLANGFYPIPGSTNRSINLYRFNQYFITVKNQAPALIMAITVGIITYFNLTVLFTHVV